MHDVIIMSFIFIPNAHVHLSVYSSCIFVNVYFPLLIVNNPSESTRELTKYDRIGDEMVMWTRYCQLPIRVEVKINGKPLLMEVDTGAAVSLISYRKLKQILPRIKINKTTVVLRTYTQT